MSYLHLCSQNEPVRTTWTIACGPLNAAKNNDPEHIAYSEALSLKPDIDNGGKLYRYCGACHGPEGRGIKDGTYPQIAGQFKDVIIKQLDDIRAGNRDNPIMRAFTSLRLLAGPQQIADVAGYKSTWPVNLDNSKSRPSAQEPSSIFNSEQAVCHGGIGSGDE